MQSPPYPAIDKEDDMKVVEQVQRSRHARIRGRSCTVAIAALFSVAPSGVIGQVSSTPTVAKRNQVPIVVNIYNNASISEAEAKEAIKAASDILQQADFTLRFFTGRTGQTAGDAGDDGDLVPAEQVDVIKKGAAEIPIVVTNKRGIKIAFVRSITTPWGDQAPAASLAGIQAIIDTRRLTANGKFDATTTGQSIAHEIGHALGLGAGHAIAPGVVANGAGHPNANDGHNDNIMAPSGRRTATKLTASQKTKLNEARYKRAKCSKQMAAAIAAQKEKEQHGAKADSDEDRTEPPPFGYLDLFYTSLASLDDEDNIYCQLDLEGLFVGDVDATYSLVFDSDNEPSTGFTYGSFTGVEYAVEINVVGTGGVYVATGLVRDLSDDSVQMFETEPRIEIAVLSYDLDGSGFPMLDSLLFNFPKLSVGLDVTIGPTSVTDVPVGVQVEADSVIHDTDSLVFNYDGWLGDPTLNTFGTGVPTPGGPYPVAISGLQPDGSFTLYVGHRAVIEDAQLDPEGAFDGSFTFPVDLPITEPYALAAQDETGEFAYSNTCPKTGACCHNSGDCTDDVTKADCSGPGDTFFPEQTCAQVEPCPVVLGACCEEGHCTDDVPQSACDSEKWWKDTPCSDPEVMEVCAAQIPTVSEWGLIVITLLGLTAGTVIFGRRRRPAAA